MKLSTVVRYVVITVLASGGVCFSSSSFSTPQPQRERSIMVDSATLTQKLLNREYGDLFAPPIPTNPMDVVWNTPGNPEALRSLVQDKNQPAKARFIAAEILMQYDSRFLAKANIDDLIALYAEALAKDYAGYANYSWARLYEFATDDGPPYLFDHAGYVGFRFLTFGKAALPALIKLLNNETVLETIYFGSDEATERSVYSFRVKDYAAYYISRITGVQIKFTRWLSERDTEIERLQAVLKKK